MYECLAHTDNTIISVTTYLDFLYAFLNVTLVTEYIKGFTAAFTINKNFELNQSEW